MNLFARFFATGATGAAINLAATWLLTHFVFGVENYFAAYLIGIAANKCFETGQPVAISDLVKGLKPQDFAPMPSHSDPEPMPAKRKS